MLSVLHTSINQKVLFVKDSLKKFSVDERAELDGKLPGDVSFRPLTRFEIERKRALEEVETRHYSELDYHDKQIISFYRGVGDKKSLENELSTHEINILKLLLGQETLGDLIYALCPDTKQDLIKVEQIEQDLMFSGLLDDPIVLKSLQKLKDGKSSVHNDYLEELLVKMLDESILYIETNFN